MLWVPLPWWTSQSMIITFETPCRAWRCRAVIAALFRRQNPIPPARAARASRGDFPVVQVARAHRHERPVEADALEVLVDRDQAVRRFRVFERGDVEQIVRMVDIRDVFHRDPGA